MRSIFPAKVPFGLRNGTLAVWVAKFVQKTLANSVLRAVHVVAQYSAGPLQ